MINWDDESTVFRLLSVSCYYNKDSHFMYRRHYKEDDFEKVLKLNFNFKKIS